MLADWEISSHVTNGEKKTKKKQCSLNILRDPDMLWSQSGEGEETRIYQCTQFTEKNR